METSHAQKKARPEQMNVAEIALRQYCGKQQDHVDDRAEIHQHIEPVAAAHPFC